MAIHGQGHQRRCVPDELLSRSRVLALPILAQAGLAGRRGDAPARHLVAQEVHLLVVHQAGRALHILVLARAGRQADVVPDVVRRPGTHTEATWPGVWAGGGMKDQAWHVAHSNNMAGWGGWVATLRQHGRV